jgi:hypothetical protein
MNRVTITFEKNGDIGRICSDAPIELYFVCPHIPEDRVYLYGGVEVGPKFVRREIGGYAVGHANDDRFEVARRKGRLEYVLPQRKRGARSVAGG